ncbi:MAG: ABC transporter permease [Candidatus Accumulibacter sp.]|jgi:sulfonate transport system permease protein|nr:ABC transporter permease [Accumulibacter sp.]
MSKNHELGFVAPRAAAAFAFRAFRLPALAWPNAVLDSLPGLRDWLADKRYIGAILPLLILGLWQAATSFRWIEPVFLPAPAAVVKAFWYMLTKQDLLMDVWASVFIIAQAFVYGTLLGVGLGFAAGLSRRVELFFGGTINTLRHIPTVAWIPLVVVWLGLGAPAKIVVLAKSIFIPVFLNTLQAIRGVDRNFIELAQALKLTRRQLIRRVVLPAILPVVMVTLRYSVGLSWALVVVAEGISGLEGLGFLIFRAQNLLMTDQLLVCMVLIGVVGYALDRLLYMAQRHLLRWQRGFGGAYA